tara:strand:+ start:429 stop:953 length:525 start_codon:yes stop_codon:yes gene_type:complete
MDRNQRRLFNKTLRAERLQRVADANITKATSTKSSSIAAAGESQGDSLIAGESSHAEVSGSHLVYLDSSKQWRRASSASTNSGSSEMVGIALSATPHVHGVIVKGSFNLSGSFVSGAVGAGTFTAGAQVYISPEISGSFTTSVPSGSGQTVRVVGHSLDSTIVYFSPSPDFLEI